MEEMSEEQKEMFKRRLEGFRIHNEQVREERKKQTIEQKWRELNDLYLFGESIGRWGPNASESHLDRWREINKKLAKHQRRKATRPRAA